MTAIDKVIDEAMNDDATGGLLPYESWEKLNGETAGAFAAFRAYRDYGPERNVRKAVDGAETDEAARAKRYRVWRRWAVVYRWRERAGDFDRYTEKLRLAEMRKTIEAQGERHRQVTGKMLDVVSKKLGTVSKVTFSKKRTVRTQGSLRRAYLIFCVNAKCH